MKVFTIGTSFIAALVWGYIFGSGMLSQPQPEPANHSRITIDKPAASLTTRPYISLVQPTNTPEAVQYAQVELVQDAPAAVYVQPEIFIQEEQPVISEAPAIAQPDVVLVQDPAVNQDLNQWVTALDPTITTPIVISPYEAMPGQIANILPAAPAGIVPLPAEVHEMSLDEMWDYVEAVGLDDRIPLCAYPLPAPFVTWDMAKELSELQTPDRVHPWIKMYASDIAMIAARGGGYFPSQGTVQILEDGTGGVKGILIGMYTNGQVNGCRNPATNKPDAYNVQDFLNLLASSYITLEAQ